MFKYFFLITVIFLTFSPLQGMEQRASSAYLPHTMQKRKAIFENALEKTFYFARIPKSQTQPQIKRKNRLHDDLLHETRTTLYTTFFVNLYNAIIFLIQCKTENQELGITITPDDLATYNGKFSTSFITFNANTNSDPRYQGKSLKTCMRMAFVEAITELINELKRLQLVADLTELHKRAINTIYFKIKDIAEQLEMPFKVPEIQEDYEDEVEVNGGVQEINRELEAIKF